MASNVIEDEESKIEIVFRNELLIEEILKKLPFKELLNARRVCKQWNEIILRIIKHQPLKLNIWFYAYTSQIRKTHVFHKAIKDHDPQPNSKDVCENIVEMTDRLRVSLNKQFTFKPRYALIIYGAFGSNCPGSKRLINSIEQCFYNRLPSDCEILSIESSAGIIGQLQSSSPELSSLEIQAGYTCLTGITCLFLPELNHHGDVGLKFFNENDTLSEFLPNSNSGLANKLKCMLVFFTDFEHLTNVHKIVNAYNGKLAVGGGVVELIRNFDANQQKFSQEQQEANGGDEEFTNRSPKTRRVTRSNSNRSHQKLNGLAFYGDGVKMASLLVTANTESEIEESLLQFKETLDFNVDISDNYHKTIAFLFICNGRGYSVYGKPNVESNLIRKHFKVAKVFGIFGYGEYGYNYCPKFYTDKNFKNLPTNRLFVNDEETWMHSFTSVIVLVHFRRSRN